jgi:CheY-like chemotaxis protein
MPKPDRSERLEARAVALAIDPAVTLEHLAATLARLAGSNRAVLENALQRVTHRDPTGRSGVNARAAAALRLALAPPAERLTVMCVDDDPNILLLLETTVEREPDFEIVGTATDTSTALELVRAHQPDVVIVDHVGSGLDLVASTRAIAPDAVIVVFSGWKGMQHAARDAGADLHIPKPDFNLLWPAIRQLRANAPS